MAKIEPLGNYVAIKSEMDKPQEVGGLMVHGNERYIVVAVGPDATQVKPDDVVVCTRDDDYIHRIEGQQYMILPESKVKARIV